MYRVNESIPNQFKPAIARRALFMVLVPALLTSALLLYLNQEWIHEGVIARQLGKNYESVAHEFYNMERAKEITMGARMGVPREHINEKYEALKAELQSLKQTAQESGASQTTLDLIDKLEKGQARMLNDLYDRNPQLMMQHMRSRDVKLDDMIAMTKVIQRGAGVAELGEALDESMDEDVAAKKRQQEEAKTRVKWTTFLLFLSIFTVAVALILLFSADVLKRLNMLIINAEFVGSRGEKLTAVGGTDELAYLNSILLESDSELKAGDEHRKSLMEMVAHDMRSPLMASQVSLEIVEKQSEQLTEKFRQGLSVAQKNLDRVLRFIEELLSIEKLEAGDIELTFETFEVTEAVSDCISSLEELAKQRNIKLTNSCSPVSIDADRRRIEQVLTNFIANAIKFSPEQTEIRISNDTIHDQVRIFVTDQGRGMSKAACRKVFDRYFQTAEGRQKQGYGLGLTICRLLIAAHGGGVGAESELGKGSTFWLRVPISQEPGVKKTKSVSMDFLQNQFNAFKARGHWLDFRHPRMLEKVVLCTIPPLLFEAGMFAWISYAMIETEKLSQNAHDHYVAMHCLNYTVSAISVGDMRLLRFFATGHDRHRELAVQDFAKARKKIAEFQTLKNTYKTSENTLQNCLSTLQLLDKLEQLANHPGPDRIDNLQAVSNLMTQTNKELNFERQEHSARRDLEANRADLSTLTEEELTMRTDVQTKIYLGIAANLLFATILIVVFGQSVTKRLNILVEHARKLTKREALEATVSGDDELAYLDTVLQRTSERLIESAEHRRAVMQMVAHDMRSPMMAAQASIELLNAVHGESLPAVGRRHLPLAEKNIDRILHLVNDLLTLDKLEAGKLELDIDTCDVQTLAEEAIATVAGLAAQVNVTLLNECENITIRGDAPRLNQVLSNLISNAIKFSAKGTTVKVISKGDAEYVSIGVQDQGPGMDESTAAQVFDKFFQSEGDKKSQGFGLGLAICKLIAESHGGKVSVESGLGVGSTFWISLPLGSVA